jgi:hypothetical protein
MGIERSSRGWGLNDKAKKERERNRDIEQNRRKYNRVSLEDRDRKSEKKR